MNAGVVEDDDHDAGPAPTGSGVPPTAIAPARTALSRWLRRGAGVLIVSIPVLDLHRAYVTAALIGAILIAGSLLALFTHSRQPAPTTAPFDGAIRRLPLKLRPRVRRAVTAASEQLHALWVPIPLGGLSYLSIRVQRWSSRHGRTTASGGGTGVGEWAPLPLGAVAEVAQTAAALLVVDLAAGVPVVEDRLRMPWKHSDAGGRTAGGAETVPTRRGPAGRRTAGRPGP